MNYWPRSTAKQKADSIGTSQSLLGNGNAGDLVALGNRVNDILALDHFSEHTVLAIKPGRGHVRDKKLAAVCIGTGVGHRQHTRGVVLQILVKFIGEFVTWTAGSGAAGATALDHEVGNHPVEDQPVVERFADKFLKIGNGFRRLFIKQLDADDALAGVKCSNFHNGLAIQFEVLEVVSRERVGPEFNRCGAYRLGPDTFFRSLAKLLELVARIALVTTSVPLAGRLIRCRI